MPSFTVAPCILDDCMFFGSEPTKAGHCRCSHPDKAMHMEQSRCPLYRLDWQKKVQGAKFIPLPGSRRPKPAP